MRRADTMPLQGDLQVILQNTFSVSLALIALAILPFLGCTQQLGKFHVVQRESFSLSDKSGIIDILYGKSTATTKATETLPLLTVITCVPGRRFDKIMRSGGDGISVSALNVDLGSNGPPDFGYGLIWNRTDDKLAINETEYVRSDGNVFVVSGGPDYYEVHQLSIVLNAPIEPKDILGEIMAKTSKDELPEGVETRLRNLSMAN